MASNPLLKIEDRENVRILRLNRPDKLNALNSELIDALHSALLEIDMNPTVRAAILAAEGRVFCAGGDLREFPGPAIEHETAAARRTKVTMDVMLLMQRISKPIVTAVHNVAAGGGAALALSGDMMVVSEDVKLFYPELKNGIVPAIVLPGLQGLIGHKLAFEIVTMNRTLEAAELLQLGLANRAVPGGDLLDTALEIAQSWAEAGPTAMARTKRLFYRTADMPYESALSAGLDAADLMRHISGIDEK